MEYVIVTGYDDIVNLIYDFKSVFPSIAKSQQTVNKYAEKFSKFAKIVEVIFDGEIAGMAVYYANDFETRTGYISLIGLKKEFRGKYIGKNLIKFVFEDMRAHEMNYIRLECADANKNAYKFYCNMGLKTEKRAGMKSFYMIKNLTEEMK